MLAQTAEQRPARARHRLGRQLRPMRWALVGAGMWIGLYFATLVLLSFRGLPNPDALTPSPGDKGSRGDWPRHTVGEAEDGDASEKENNGYGRWSMRIFVFGWRRRESTMRLLHSLEASQYSCSVDLLPLLAGRQLSIVLQIDGDASESLVEAVLEWKQSQVWALGAVEVNVNKLRKGLVNQVISAWEHPSADSLALFLEDDVAVSPQWCSWVKAALSKGYVPAKEVPWLMGISLASHRVNQFLTRGHQRRLQWHGILPPPFEKMKQVSGDNIYARTKYGPLQSLPNRFQGNVSLLMTAPSSWGAIYFGPFWLRFLEFWKERRQDTDNIIPHSMSNAWTQSWKRAVLELSYASGAAMLYPNFEDEYSFATTYREPGLHTGVGGTAESPLDNTSSTFNWEFSVPLFGAATAALEIGDVRIMGADSADRFHEITSASYEPLWKFNSVPVLLGDPYLIDIYGLERKRSQVIRTGADWLLTTRDPEVDRRAFLGVMGPLLNIPGDQVFRFLDAEARQAQSLSKILAVITIPSTSDISKYSKIFAGYDALWPDVHLIVFAPKDVCDALFIQLDISCYDETMCYSDTVTIPTLRCMLQVADNHPMTSPEYLLYSNADIILLPDILDAVNAVRELCPGEFLLTGTRHDVQEYPEINFVQLSRAQTRSRAVDEIRKLLRFRGLLHAAASADYFVIRRHSIILWDEGFLSTFVPGGQRWDQSLMLRASLDSNISSIDGTSFITAIHLNHTGGGSPAANRHNLALSPLGFRVGSAKNLNFALADASNGSLALQKLKSQFQVEYIAKHRRRADLLLAAGEAIVDHHAPVHALELARLISLLKSTLELPVSGSVDCVVAKLFNQSSMVLNSERKAGRLNSVTLPHVINFIDDMKSRWSETRNRQLLCSKSSGGDVAPRADCSKLDAEQHLFEMLESQTCKTTGPPFSFRFMRQFIGVYGPECPGVEAVQDSLKLYFDPSIAEASGTALVHWLSCGQAHLDSREFSAGLKAIDQAHSRSSSRQLRAGIFWEPGRAIQQVIKVLDFPRAPSHSSDHHWLLQGYHGPDNQQSEQGANTTRLEPADRLDLDMMLMILNPEKEDFEYFRIHGDPPYSPTAAFLRVLVQSQLSLYRIVSQELYGLSPCMPPPFKSQNHKFCFERVVFDDIDSLVEELAADIKLGLDSGYMPTFLAAKAGLMPPVKPPIEGEQG